MAGSECAHIVVPGDYDRCADFIVSGDKVGVAIIEQSIIN